MTEDGSDALWSLMGMDIDVFSWAYDPASTAALTETALETATNEEMDALVTRLSTAAQQKLARCACHPSAGSHANHHEQ